MTATVAIDSYTVRRNIPLRMRDGVSLSADIWLPDTARPVSAILWRTPYNKDLANFDFLRPADAVAAGFAAVVQDTRGRFASDGDWRPIMWEQEAEDGYDTVEWIAAQSWSSGAVGMSGPSYLGISQLMAAQLRPPHLKAMRSASTRRPAIRWRRRRARARLRALSGGKVLPSGLKALRRRRRTLRTVFGCRTIRIFVPAAPGLRPAVLAMSGI